jgi:acyl phosphate:glycerol-3-phosphate acyltransferase
MGRDVLVAVASLTAAYLVGGIPFSLIVGKVFFRTDLREQGSGNLGATNTFRVLGPTAGIAVLLLDAAKGGAAIALVEVLLRGAGEWRTWFLLLVMFAVIAGHVYSPYLRFHGGKGVASAAGALLVLMPKVALILLVVFALVVALTRMVSLASIAVAVLFPALSYFLYSTDPAAIALTVVAAALVLWRHRTNISRIIRGEEPRIGRTGENA